MVKVAMSSDLEGDKQVYQVQKRIVRGGIARQQRFNLFFVNGKLVKYEKIRGILILKIVSYGSE